MSAATVTGPQPAPTIGPLPFIRLWRVEWGKSLETRSARWLLAVALLVTCGVLAIPLAVADVEQSRESYLMFATSAMALLLPLVSILTLTSEWTQRSVLVTFAQEPRRGRVLAAKLFCGLVLALVASLVTIGLALAAAGIAGTVLGRDVQGGPGWGVLVGAVLFLLLSSALGMGFGALLQNTAAAIVLVLVLPTAWAILVSVPALQTLGEWLDTARTFAPLQTWDWGAGDEVRTAVAQLAVSAAVWIGVPLALGAVRTVRREVS